MNLKENLSIDVYTDCYKSQNCAGFFEFKN